MNLEQHYDELIAKRDRVNAANAPLEAALAEANAQVQAAQARAMELVAQIDANRGGMAWVELKREIRLLAPSLEKARAVRRSAVQASA